MSSPLHSELLWETERFIQRGRMAALVLAFGLAVSFGSDRSVGITAAVILLAIDVVAVELVLSRARRRRPIVLAGWWSFTLDAAVCGLALSAVADPVDPIVMIILMIAIEAAVRWGAAGATAGGLLAGGLGVAWAASGYEAIGRELPATSVAFRALAPVVIALPPGLLIERLGSQRELNRRLFEHASEPIVVVSDGQVIAANPAACRLVGEPAERLRDEPFSARFGPLLEVQDIQTLLAVSPAERPPVRIAVQGQSRWFRVSADGAGDHGPVFVTARDVTEERRREQQLRFRALHDPLTGLPNRAALEARLADWLGDQRMLGVVFLDLDGFKEVNDVHGHAAGDAVLVDVAKRLREVTRDADAVHRWAGDEFCLVVRDTDGAGLKGLVQRVDHALSQPFDLDETSVVVGASMGAALAEPDDSAASLIHRADQQMYRRKQPRHTPRPATDLPAPTSGAVRQSAR